MVQRQHNVAEPVPPFYIQTLISLEGSINTTVAKEKEAKKKMNATNAKALTAVKQKVKKALKEYEFEVKKYQTVSCNILGLTYIRLTPHRTQRHSSANIQRWLLLNPLPPESDLRPKLAMPKRMMTSPPLVRGAR